MRVIINILLCFSLLLTGCKARQELPDGNLRQTSWLERRLDRLDTWETRHGYPIHKTKETTKLVAVSILVTAGAVASVAAYLWLNGEYDKQYGSHVPFNDPSWSPGK